MIGTWCFVAKNDVAAAQLVSSLWEQRLKMGSCDADLEAVLRHATGTDIPDSGEIFEPCA